MRTKKFNYNLSYAELAITSKNKANAALRDINEFNKVGINEQFITDFRIDITEMDSMNIDEDMLGRQALVTKLKNERSKQLIRQIRITMSTVENVYPKHSVEYQRILPESLSSYSNSKLYRLANSVIRILEEIQPDLEPYGFTNENIAILSALNEEFSQLLEDKTEAVYNRDIQTQVRQEIADKVYRKLSRLCSAGQALWFGIDEARYNDFIIYKSKSEEKEEEVELTELFQ